MKHFFEVNSRGLLLKTIGCSSVASIEATEAIASVKQMDKRNIIGYN
jgi:hypothetical protein